MFQNPFIAPARVLRRALPIVVACLAVATASAAGHSTAQHRTATPARRHDTPHRARHATRTGRKALVVAHIASTQASIADRLSANRSSIEITSLPSGSTSIHVAVMANLAGQGLRYLNIPVTQKSYTPPKATPVVDVQALKNGSPLGGWAGRKQTTPPAEAPKVEPPKEEAPKVEPPKVEAPKEQPKVEPPHEEPPASEPTASEPPAGETPSAPMIVGVDTGGWDWESAIKDVSGAVRYIRSEYTNYDSEAQMSMLAKYGVHLLPLFNEWSSANLVSWFKRYGKGGTFWAGRTDLGATTAEIVNEPGNPYFWGAGAQSDQARYAALIEEDAKAIEALPVGDRPTLLVSYDGGYEGDSYGRTLVKDDPNLLKLGLGWTVHPYGGHGSVGASALGNRARVTEAPHPVYVTEVGWPTATGMEPTGDSLQWSEAQQAENLTSFFSWADSLGYVRAVVDFNYADYAPNNYYGIVNSTGTTHKQSYAAVAAASSKW